MYQVFKQSHGGEMSLVNPEPIEVLSDAMTLAESTATVEGVATTVEESVVGGTRGVAQFGSPATPEASAPGPIATVEPAPSRLGWADFLDLFTTAERIGIRAAALADPIVDDYMKLGEARGYVLITSPAAQRGLGYLAMKGLLTAERAAEIAGA